MNKSEPPKLYSIVERDLRRVEVRPNKDAVHMASYLMPTCKDLNNPYGNTHGLRCQFSFYTLLLVK